VSENKAIENAAAAAAGEAVFADAKAIVNSVTIFGRAMVGTGKSVKTLAAGFYQVNRKVTDVESGKVAEVWRFAKDSNGKTFGSWSKFLAYQMAAFEVENTDIVRKAIAGITLDLGKGYAEAMEASGMPASSVYEVNKRIKAAKAQAASEGKELTSDEIVAAAAPPRKQRTTGGTTDVKAKAKKSLDQAISATTKANDNIADMTKAERAKYALTLAEALNMVNAMRESKGEITKVQKTAATRTSRATKAKASA